MRLADTFENEERARRICDYLLSQGIDSTLRATGESFGVWIIEESDLKTASAILREFREDPTADKFQRGAQEASTIRQVRRRASEAQQKREVQVRRRWAPPTMADIPVTAGLVLVCVALAIMTDFGRNHSGVSSYFFTLVHYGWMHLLFNMLIFFQLGALVEHRRGTLRYLGLLLLFAAAAEILQVLWAPGTKSFGMSGVVYGLIGYAWMKTKHEPRLGIHISPGLFVFALFWFFLCMIAPPVNLGSGAVGVANAAHAGGLITGLLVGRIPAR